MALATQWSCPAKVPGGGAQPQQAMTLPATEVWEGSQAQCQLSHGPAVLLQQPCSHPVLLSQPGALPAPCLCSCLGSSTCFTAGYQSATVDEDDRKLQVQPRFQRVRFQQRLEMTSLWRVFMPRVEARVPALKGKSRPGGEAAGEQGAQAWRWYLNQTSNFFQGCECCTTVLYRGIPTRSWRYRQGQL